MVQIVKSFWSILLLKRPLRDKLCEGFKERSFREAKTELVVERKPIYIQTTAFHFKEVFVTIDKVFKCHPYFLLPNTCVLCRPCRAVCNFPLLWCKLVILRVTQSDTLFPLPLLELGPAPRLQIQTENFEHISFFGQLYQIIIGAWQW